MGLRVTCKQCGGAHPAYECRKKSTAARKDVQDRSSGHPYSGKGSLRRKPSDKVVVAAWQDERNKQLPAGTQALPVDTNTRVEDNVGARLLVSEARETTSAGTVGYKDRQPIPKRGRGRPRTITDMKAYKAMKQREYRARKKNG